MNRFIACLSLCLSVLFLAACGSDTPAQLNIGDKAPAFSTMRADGAPVNFPQDFAGKAVALRFWADWCKYCEPEMIAIDPVWRRLRARGFEVLAVNAGQDRVTVGTFMQRLGVGYPALLDEDATIAKRYGVVGLPTTYFVDAQGVVRAKLVGEADAAGFERAAQTVLP